MWAHYADSHRGVCLGFNLELIRERKAMRDHVVPRAVDYTDGNPFVPLLNQIANSVFYSSPPGPPSAHAIYTYALESALATKSHAWAYEQEFRFLRLALGPGTVKFESKALTEVILGCNIAKRDKSTLPNLLGGAEWAHVQIYEIHKSPALLSFEVVEMRRGS